MTSSLKTNILSSYVSQIYVATIGVLILPLYLEYMGSEVYGLIAFFAMLQAWFSLLDLGLTPTIARETARFHGGTISALEYRRVLRALTLIFLGTAILGGAGLWFSANLIASKWLSINTIPQSDVVFAMKTMSISIALRWLCGLYRGVINGSERLLLLAIFNISVASARFLGVFIAMHLYGYTPTIFFIYQLVVACIEVLCLTLISSLLTPRKSLLGAPIGWSFSVVKPLIKFSLTIAFTSSVWVLITQTDKLILSGVLSLENYGYFALAVLLASIIILSSSPITNAVMPRMARLHAEGKEKELINIYCDTSKIVTITAGILSLILCVFAEEVLFVWTGDVNLTHNVAPILRLYSLGNGFLVISAFPYYLQYAIGNLRYHFIGNLIMLLTLIPTVVYFSREHGAIGAGYCWLITNVAYFLIWTGFVHHKLRPGLHLLWLKHSVIRLFVYPSIFITLSYFLVQYATGRLSTLFAIVIVTVVSIFLSSISSSELRVKVKSIFSRSLNAC